MSEVMNDGVVSVNVKGPGGTGGPKSLVPMNE
jgi:hypothetical protein